MKKEKTQDRIEETIKKKRKKRNIYPLLNEDYNFYPDEKKRFIKSNRLIEI